MKIRFDSHTLGNLAKNLAPAVAFTPAGMVGAGLLGAVGGLARGEKVGRALKSGVSNAAIGGGLSAAAGKIGLGQGARSGAEFFHLPGAPSAPTPDTQIGAVPGPSSMASGGGSAVTNGAIQTGASAGLPGATVPGGQGNAVGRLLGFAEAHPNATAGALQGAGSIIGSTAENRLRNAQADTLEQQAGETRYDFERRKMRDQQLAPVWGALGTGGAQGYAGIAKNPYGG